MTQFLRSTGGVTAPKGFSASGIHCGIRKNRSKRDLALIFSDTMCDAAAVHTLSLIHIFLRRFWEACARVVWTQLNISQTNIWLGDSYEERNNAFCIGIYHCIIVYNDRICNRRTGEHNKYLWLYGSRFRVSQQRMKSPDVKQIYPDNAERKVLSWRERTVL